MRGDWQEKILLLHFEGYAASYNAAIMIMAVSYMEPVSSVNSFELCRDIVWGLLVIHYAVYMSLEDSE